MFRCSNFFDTMSILYLDVDKFKDINDKHGHIVGDQVLKNIINTIKKNIRRSDYIVRMGGDEFIIVFIKTNGKKALQITARIQQSINNEIEYIGSDMYPVTVSLGLTEYRLGDTFNVLIKRVDELVYKSKKIGDGHLTHDI